MDYKLETVEFNINQPMETIYSEILDKNADVIGFSAYIWNIQFIEMISSDLKKANPNLFQTIILYRQAISNLYSVMDHRNEFLLPMPYDIHYRICMQKLL